MSEPVHRGARCGVCYWALYDGDWCQNPKCKMKGKSVNENRVHLTNKEAKVLIDSKDQNHPPIHMLDKAKSEWIERKLGQIGIDIRQPKHHISMRYYMELLKEEIEITERFLRNDR